MRLHDVLLEQQLMDAPEDLLQPQNQTLIHTSLRPGLQQIVRGGVEDRCVPSVCGEDDNKYKLHKYKLHSSNYISVNYISTT